MSLVSKYRHFLFGFMKRTVVSQTEFINKKSTLLLVRNLATVPRQYMSKS